MALQLSNCKRCGIVFAKGFKDICMKCAELENDHVQKICDFAEEKESISIQEISNSTGIDEKDIESYLKKGRLSRIVKKLSVKCKVCGTIIHDTTQQGFMCDECVKKMGKDPENRKSVSEIQQEPRQIKIPVKQTDKEILNTNTNANTKKEDPKEHRKYGFKKNYD